MASSRKRRRVLIATIVAVLLTGGGWWLSRPRIDARLVGKWRLPKGDPWTLRVDGTAGIRGSEYRWSSDGEIVTFKDPGIGNLLLDAVAPCYERISGLPLKRGSNWMVIVHSINGDTLQIDNLDGTMVDWHRVSD